MSVFSQLHQADGPAHLYGRSKWSVAAIILTHAVDARRGSAVRRDSESGRWHRSHLGQYRHAEIYPEGDSWWVRDLGSADGTFLDDESIDVAPVSGPATLQLGGDGPTIQLTLAR